ncbi:hypothetical protein ASPCAL14994 [Aspergillus calidoustus]|uniref:aldehyde dehydrogenase (NAD(+)) n=1 Tax=Aspergillus calidoustus TaxID=454130 RepID=A0A0U5GIJ2_ASPCI|nr:hypothetical protein ASPCAL14994 [Aspergillus calidoustus]
MGPLQNAMQYEKVKTFFEGVTPDQLSLTNAEDSPLATAEQFGPNLPFLTCKDESDVIARANGTRMGLGASVWSNDLDEAARIAVKLQAGSCGSIHIWSLVGARYLVNTRREWDWL